MSREPTIQTAKIRLHAGTHQRGGRHRHCHFTRGMSRRPSWEHLIKRLCRAPVPSAVSAWPTTRRPSPRQLLALDARDRRAGKTAFSAHVCLLMTCSRTPSMERAKHAHGRGPASFRPSRRCIPIAPSSPVSACVHGISWCRHVATRDERPAHEETTGEHAEGLTAAQHNARYPPLPSLSISADPPDRSPTLGSASAPGDCTRTPYRTSASPQDSLWQNGHEGGPAIPGVE
jgi:hypothetical protein